MDPFALFQQWFSTAQQDPRLGDASACTLASASKEGRPSARMVLLKEASERGFVFYTNYGSRKGQELSNNPWAALCFYWWSLGRQVRIEGRVELLSPTESDAYFASRPRQSQLGAWASPQSQPCTPKLLSRRFAAVSREFAEQKIPRPAFWGGWRLLAERLEFWQAGEARLHDRQCYERFATGWRCQQLFP